MDTGRRLIANQGDIKVWVELFGNSKRNIC